MTERDAVLAEVLAGGEAHGEAAALRSLATVYLLAARNHRSAGGCRGLIALRVEELARGLEADADQIEAMAEVSRV